MQIAKFAEGESFVLMQKLARDRVKQATDGTPAAAAAAEHEEEAGLCQELRGARTAEWVAKTEQVHLLAELVMDRVMEAAVGAPIPKGVARPFARL